MLSVAKTKTAKTKAKKAPRKKATKKSTAKKTTVKSKKKTAAKKKPKTTRKKAVKTPDDEVTVDRRRKNRRDADTAEIVAEDTQLTPPVDAAPAERRKKAPRRRQIDPTTCERDYSDDEIEFMHALDEYKRANGRMFPTCSEILEVVRDLGYARVEKTETTDGTQVPGVESQGAQPEGEDSNLSVTPDHVTLGDTDEVSNLASDGSDEATNALPNVDLTDDFTDTSGIHSF